MPNDEVSTVRLVLDTHCLVWFLEENSRLSRRAFEAMSAKNAELIIPTIALAEVFFLNARKRIGVSLSEVHDFVTGSSNCSVYPFDEFVVEFLPAGLNIHDAIIVATALMLRDYLGENVALVTKDAKVIAFNLIETIW
jgi:PIN domain nuclease of toxin-antitoxin system